MSDNLKADPRSDDHVVGEIVSCLLSQPPKSFFLYAGAGSGKTRTLVAVLQEVLKRRGRRMLLVGQRVGVITYTNAACNEILHRLDHNPLFDVRTIHSFVWNLVQGFNGDIREWLRQNLLAEIEAVEAEHAKGRAGTKAAAGRERSIVAKRERLDLLDQVRTFTYSPESDNRERGSLNHSEVVGLVSTLLQTKSVMRELLVSRYPMLLVDESQDTNRYLLDALVNMQQECGTVS